MKIIKRKIIKPRDVKKLAKYLEKEFPLKDYFIPVERTKYSITMDNDYISHKGYLVKQQHLEGIFSRELENLLSESAAGFIYTWKGISYSGLDKKNKQELIPWTFAKNREFRYYKTFSKNCFPEKAVDSGDCQSCNTGRWYNDLINVPAVNLLYMLTWDIIFFEELNSMIISEGLEKIGAVSLMSSMSNSYVQLSFKGCNFEHSFFKNGNVHVNFLGVSSFKKKPVCIYEYKSIGALNVEKQKREIKQEGESFFLGKLYISLQNGDLLFSELIELLTVSITNSQGKIVPMQKRRYVQLQNLTEVKASNKSIKRYIKGGGKR
jgi:hypothetical protein